MQDPNHLSLLVWTIIYAALGIIIFITAFFGIVKLSPFSVRKEIEEDQNTALAVIIGSVIIGLAIIIAAAIT
jgi:putative membrane protein